MTRKLLPHEAVNLLALTAAVSTLAFRSSFRGEAAPTTHKGQLDSLVGAVGATDFASAQGAISQLQGWNGQRQALFSALGGTGDVPANYDFAGAISSRLQIEQAICSALGCTDFAQAEAKVTELAALAGNWNAIVADLGTKDTPITDLAGATKAIADMRSAATDFEGKVRTEVVRRASSAGLAAPVAKVADQQTQKANTMSRADWRTLSPHDQSEFFSKGGVLTDAE